MTTSAQPSLLIGLGGRAVLARLLAHLDDRPVEVLVKPEEQAEWADLPTIPLVFRAEDPLHHFRCACLEPGFLADLRARSFASVIVPALVPTAWRDNSLESLAAEIAGTVELIAPDAGSHRSYQGEALHRLIYNKAYLASMLTVVPPPATMARVLEVGCSDGLACDLLAQLGARDVHGVDLWTENVGSVYAGPHTHFSRSDANRLDFPDGHFDLVYSIATFEHLQDPVRVLEEMYRVTRVGGCVYVQAGPLYHSPFGHHMFDWFADFPWAHLRRSEAELAGHLRAAGKADQLKARTGQSPESYVHHMLSRNHINGFLLEQYHLENFARRQGAEILKFTVSHEGRELLTPAILAEVPGRDERELVEHGFEICLRRPRAAQPELLAGPPVEGTSP